ncbi:metal-binding protein [Clostridium oryzae]|uniref:Metal-binding protein n=1 Tax=Clostridium oryzae TaxID=1450648 RepID=A0A1V4IMQ5_9CLOT|nr:metal-binding protein [Clostridium oryzae]OPJ61311.1 hypothetical protein CLORY_23510 [Clostridium oryzae]
MTLREIMKYIESEYEVINKTHCEVCGGEFITEQIQLSIIEGAPFDVCSCTCENCGHEKDFFFSAPFVYEDGEPFNNTLN